MRHIDFGSTYSFKPFYSEECKTMITSESQMNKVYRQNGVRALGDCEKLRERARFIRKNKQEIIKERYEKAGFKYKPGEDMRMHPNEKELVSRGVSPYRRKYF